ncbi:hypothetical protein F5Y10DRAFT_204735 [Nemania abortiva]|nr:hypothetical protein F5Y10DRAFT_204735 [Nemania abortiva]
MQVSSYLRCFILAYEKGLHRSGLSCKTRSESGSVMVAIVPERSHYTRTREPLLACRKLSRECSRIAAKPCRYVSIATYAILQLIATCMFVSLIRTIYIIFGCQVLFFLRLRLVTESLSRFPNSLTSLLIGALSRRLFPAVKPNGRSQTLPEMMGVEQGIFFEASLVGG